MLSLGLDLLSKVVLDSFVFYFLSLTLCFFFLKVKKILYIYAIKLYIKFLSICFLLSSCHCSNSFHIGSQRNPLSRSTFIDHGHCFGIFSVSKKKKKKMTGSIGNIVFALVFMCFESFQKEKKK